LENSVTLSWFAYTKNILTCIYQFFHLSNLYFIVMWSETVGLRTRPVWDQKNRSWSWYCRFGIVCGKRSCHNDLGGHSNF